MQKIMKLLSDPKHTLNHLKLSGVWYLNWEYILNIDVNKPNKYPWPQKPLNTRAVEIGDLEIRIAILWWQ